MDKKDNTGSSCSCTPDPQTQSCSCLTDNPPVSEIRTTDSTDHGCQPARPLPCPLGLEAGEPPGRARPLPSREPGSGLPGLCLCKLHAQFRCPAVCPCRYRCLDPRAGYQRDQCLVCCRKRHIRDGGTGPKDRMYRSCRDCPPSEDHCPPAGGAGDLMAGGDAEVEIPC